MAGKGEKTIKTTIELAGEKEYNAALREAQRNLKTLRSELKAETAELGTNATAQQKSEARIKSLKQQIAEQEKVVATLTKALAEANRDYGDNQDVVQKWEQKLNYARATLAGMQNDLESLNGAMEGVNDATEMGVVATKSFADAIGEIGGMCDSVADGIEGIFRGMIGAVQEAVTELWDFIGTTAAKANMWGDIGQYWGTDAATIQMYANTVSSVGKSFEDLQTIVSRLVLGGKGDKIAEYLGISENNYDNQWDYAMACMERMNQLRQQGALQDGFWEDIFGEKKSTKAMDMLNGWTAIMEGLKTYNADEGGFGMDSEALAKMDEIWVQMNKIQTMWTALKDQVAAGLGEVTLPLMIDVQGGLEALNDYLKADSDEARQAALEALVGQIEQFFTDLEKALRQGVEKLHEVAGAFQESDNPAVQQLGNLLEGITDSLEWVINHADAVKKALEAMFGLWLVAKLGSIAALVTGIVAKIEVIKAFSSGGFGLGSGAAGGAAGGAATGGGGAAAGGAATGVGGMGVLMGTVLNAAVAYLFKNAMDYRSLLPERIGSAENVEYVAEQDDELKRLLIEYIDTQSEQQEYMDKGDFDSDEAGEAMRRAAEASEQFWAQEGAKELYDLYNDWRQENGMGNADWAMWDEPFDKWELNAPGGDLEGELEAMNDTLDSHMTQMEQLLGGGNTIPSNPEVAQGIMEGINGVGGAVTDLPAAVANAVKTVVGNIRVYVDGEQITNRVSVGIAGVVKGMIK